VLGIDPGLGSTGWGVVDQKDGRLSLVGYGCITTESGEPQGARLLAIFDRVSELIGTYRPALVGMESLFFARNVTSALPVAEARGVVILCLARHGVPLREFTPNAIKKSVSGSARADKRTVQDFVRLLLGMTSIPKPDHAADALAAAIARIHALP
jgi:crossover junction endodeoxyribonuclease RuvC